MKQHILQKKEISESENFIKANQIFNNLCEFISDKNTLLKINETHKLNAKSSEIQNILAEKLHELNFISEKKGLFLNESVANLRPDFYLNLSEKEGIIIEVERGKTLDNNMDLLDIWKCHICTEANYLFLIIPKIKQTNKGSEQKIFDRTINRLAPFFKPHNYVNVDAVFIIGY